MNAVVASASTMPTVTQSRSARSTFLFGRILTQAATLLVAADTGVSAGAGRSSALCCKRSGSGPGLDILNHRRNQAELQCKAEEALYRWTPTTGLLGRYFRVRGLTQVGRKARAARRRSGRTPSRGFSYHQLRFHHSFFSDFDPLDAL